MISLFTLFNCYKPRLWYSIYIWFYVNVAYFKAFKLLLIVSIFAIVSASFLRSMVITCSGAFATKRSLDSFF